MVLEIKVPKLGESITEATLGKWRKKEGEPVVKDEVLAELETDKINIEINAEANGVLEKIFAKEGSTVKIGDVIASIKEGEAVQQATVVKSPKAEVPEPVGKILSPAAKKMASENDIDVNKIQGTGKGARVTKEDMLKLNTSTPSSVPSAPTPKTSSKDRGEERVSMSRLRQKIAERLKESQNTAAILTTFNEVDMSQVIYLRNQYKDSFFKEHGVKLGFMSFFVKATVDALKHIPMVNAQLEGTDIIYKSYCDIGVAVGTEKGLVVPILRNAEKMEFHDIEIKIAELASKAREGKLSMEDLSGGTFSITNGGVYGSLFSTPIINPPQSGILGLHNIVSRPVAIDDKVEIRSMMYIALSYDHRIVDGKDAVTFLVNIKKSMEDPYFIRAGLAWD